jgi:phasin family protein
MNTDKFNKTEGMFNLFKDFKPPAMDLKGVMSRFEENLEFIKSTQQMRMDTAKEVMDIQRKYMQELMEEWNELTRNAISKEAFQVKTSHHAEVVKEAAAKALENFQELNTVLVKSNEEILKNFQERMTKVSKDLEEDGKKAAASAEEAGRKVAAGAEEAGKKAAAGAQEAGRKVAEGIDNAGKKIEKGTENTFRK